MKNSRDANNKQDEIDLVLLIVVLIKRKWIIIITILIALFLSGIYLIFFQHINYIANLEITSRQEFTIDERNTLIPSYPKLQNLSNSINNELNPTQAVSGEEEQYYTYSVTINKDEYQNDLSISIQIIGSKKRLNESIKKIFQLYLQHDNSIDEKNTILAKKAKISFEAALNQKRGMADNLLLLLNTEKDSPLSQEGANALLYMINTLTAEYLGIENSMLINDNVKSSKGNFLLLTHSSSGNKQIAINQENINNILPYIVPEKSKKRQFLPLIVSVLLAFLFGIVLVYVVDFFSREDVKRRLREIKK